MTSQVRLHLFLAPFPEIFRASRSAFAFGFGRGLEVLSQITEPTKRND